MEYIALEEAFDIPELAARRADAGRDTEGT